MSGGGSCVRVARRFFLCQARRGPVAAPPFLQQKKELTVVLLRGALKARLGIDGDKVHRAIVEAVPHVERAVGLGRRHAEARVVGGEVGQGVAPVLRHQAVGRVALDLVVACPRGVEGRGCVRHCAVLGARVCAEGRAEAQVRKCASLTRGCHVGHGRGEGLHVVHVLVPHLQRCVWGETLRREGAVERPRRACVPSRSRIRRCSPGA